jgi:hypothetical protein
VDGGEEGEFECEADVGYSVLTSVYKGFVWHGHGVYKERENQIDWNQKKWEYNRRSQLSC